MLHLILLASAVTGLAAADREPPRAAMPERVYSLLVEVNRTAEITNGEPQRSSGSALQAVPQCTASNAAALHIFRQLEWPDVSRMKRVRVREAGPPTAGDNLFKGRWLFYDQDGQLIFLVFGFDMEWRIRDRTVMEDADYGAELAELIEVLQTSLSAGSRRWDWTVMSRTPAKWSPATLPLVYHAVAAAWLGYTNEARVLWQQMVNTQYASHNLWNYIAAQAARDSAIDRWQEWWTKTGEEQWLAAHPETRPAFGTRENEPAALDGAALPDLVRVLPAELREQMEYELPRAQVAALVRRGLVEYRSFAGVTQFRFGASADAFKIFSVAESVPFRHAAYTNLAGKAGVTVPRPGVASNAFLLPMMRIADVELAAPDEEGRSWLVQGDGTNRLILCDGSRRTTLFQHTNEPYAEAVRWLFAYPLEDGAMIVEKIHRRQTRFHFFDGRHQSEFDSLQELVQAEARRLRRRLPSGPRLRGFGGNGMFQIVKDREDNLWWVDLRQAGVLAGTNQVVVSREDMLLGEQRYYSFTWVMPLPSEEGVLIADHGYAAVIHLDQDRFKVGATRELPGASLRDTGDGWPRFVPDREGRLWISSRESPAFDAKLQLAGKQPGHVLLGDPDGGVWFVDYDSSLDIGLIRLDPDGSESELRLPGLNGPPCLGPGQTVWVLTRRELVEISYRRGRLQALAEAPVQWGNDARIWLDGDKRIWITGAGGRDGRWTVVCCNTRR